MELVSVSVATKRLLMLSKVKGVGKKTLLYFAKDMILRDELSDSWESLCKEWCCTTSEYRLEIASQVEKDILHCISLGVNIFSAADAEYPKAFLKMPDAPSIIYCKGDYQLLNYKSLAIIGTRQPTSYGVESARRITRWYVESGWTIVSGLAVGIDSVAHEECLASGGKTVAVLAQGLDKVYPAENRGLASRIIEQGGLLLSEYAPFSRTFKSSFVERDRLQAGLSAGTILVQTGIEGGSLHASRGALAYDRCLIVVHPLDPDIGEGCEKIQGNLKIINAENQGELASYLKCLPYFLKNILILKGRADYPLVNDQLLKIHSGF